MTYYIRERWLVAGTLEIYDEKTNPKSNKVKNLDAVKAWIKDWIETWKDNAEDNEYKVTSIKTDYKTFAEIRIKENGHMDTFKLKVVNPSKKDKVYVWKSGGN